MSRSVVFRACAIVTVALLAHIPSAGNSAPDATVASSGGGSPCDRDWCSDCPPPQVATGGILITPEGNGPRLGDQGLTITVTVLECDGAAPFEGYPAEAVGLMDIWNNVSFCDAVADHPTDAQGQTTFTGAIAGGGWAVDGVFATVSFAPVDPALPLSFNSPDINGDLHVNLADVGIFAVDFIDPVYDFRSDFTHDGFENLADMAVLARHLGESCPR